MHPRASELIAQLQLVPHPEGGFYREIHRSTQMVQPADERPSRHALTAIYFLLIESTHSRWHRVLSDEVWHLYEGGPIELLQADPAADSFATLQLGAPAAGSAPVQTVPAAWWQAARPRCSYALMGCTVAPGFEFADFVFMRDFPEPCRKLRQHRPSWAVLL